MTIKKTAPILAMRVLKIGATSSISGRSQLGYQVGCNADGDILLKVSSNSSSGQFNADWVSLAAIEKLLAAHPADKPMSSRVLQPVYRGQSTNSPSFLLGCLLAEGLVKVGVEKDSGYTIGDIAAFRESVSALIAVGTDLATGTPPESPKKKRPAKESE
jgi:hypothetical protein